MFRPSIAALFAVFAFALGLLPLSAYQTDRRPEVQHVTTSAQFDFVAGDGASLDGGAWVAKLPLSTGGVGYLRVKQPPQVDDQHPLTYFEDVEQGYVETTSRAGKIGRDLWFIALAVMGLIATLANLAISIWRHHPHLLRARM